MNSRNSKLAVNENYGCEKISTMHLEHVRLERHSKSGCGCEYRYLEEPIPSPYMIIRIKSCMSFNVWVYNSRYSKM